MVDDITPNTKSTPKTSPQTDSSVDQMRTRYGYYIAMTGIILSAVIALFLVVVGWKVSSDVVAVVGVFTSVTGTLVGAFLGVQVGSAGKEADQQERKNAQKLTARAMGALEPDKAEKVLKEHYALIEGQHKQNH
ncbi:MAG: hypothetical protein ABR999_02360 [Methanoregula sp.]|jgi:hypothetical protein|uniref:hypothetical protein n=1 Tax=Methanoregula sp. TaxID=2052170 RepID=UPI003D0FBD84